MFNSSRQSVNPYVSMNEMRRRRADSQVKKQNELANTVIDIEKLEELFTLPKLIDISEVRISLTSPRSFRHMHGVFSIDSSVIKAHLPEIYRDELVKALRHQNPETLLCALAMREIYKEHVDGKEIADKLRVVRKHFIDGKLAINIAGTEKSHFHELSSQTISTVNFAVKSYFNDLRLANMTSHPVSTSHIRKEELLELCQDFESAKFCFPQEFKLNLQDIFQLQDWQPTLSPRG